MSTQTVEQHTTRGRLATIWLRFALAATFLTRLPITIHGEVTDEDMRASMAWYPLVGFGLGATGWGIYLACAKIFPDAQLLAAVLVIILLEFFTGALHLDGFMDTCDGLGSNAPRERMLEIMKDSRSGAMGVFGAIAVLLVKVAGLSALTPSQAMPVLLIGWAAARLIPVLDVTLFPYARAKGTGGLFIGANAPLTRTLALTSTLCISGLVGNWLGLLFSLGIVSLTLLVQYGISRKLGGLTGDVYGLGIELVEVLALVAGNVLIRWTSF